MRVCRDKKTDKLIVRWTLHIILSVTSLSCSNGTKPYSCSFLLSLFILFYLDSKMHRSLSLLTIPFYDFYLISSFSRDISFYSMITCKSGQ